MKIVDNLIDAFKSDATMDIMKDEFIGNQRAEGSFFDLLDAGMAFFFKHLNLSGKITNHSLQREERLEVPYKALREALIFCLCDLQTTDQIVVRGT